MLSIAKKKLLHEGTVIPAHPLALTEDKQLDEARQRRLTNYYLEAGAGGIAVGVHTTQFEIREFGLYKRVLQLAVEEVKKRKDRRPFLAIAGVCGPVEQALEETKTAKELGYDMVLLSNGSLTDYSEEQLLERTKQVAAFMPIFGFYLQPSVGGRILSYDFWRKFSDIPNVHAIKLAPFNRYQTLEVVRAVCHSKRNEEIALYTGNDDNIVIDLLSSYEIEVHGNTVKKQIAGGLLGHWAVWTHSAVSMFNEWKQLKQNSMLPASLLTRANEVTDTNAAFFDAQNGFKGCIAGINEVLHRQGLLAGNWCLLDHERLSPGQSEAIDRVYSNYPHLHDDLFVKEFLMNYTE